MNTKINQVYFYEFPELESERLIFRKFSLTDSKNLFLIRSDEEVMKYMDTAVMKTVQEAEIMIFVMADSYSKQEGINWAIVEKGTNAFIGYFGFWRIMNPHSRAEIGYALNPDYCGNGYMAETIKTMIKFGFEELQLHSIEANVNPMNCRSVKLLEKFGFKKEAYFRENLFFNNKYVDSVIYSLLESD